MILGETRTDLYDRGLHWIRILGNIIQKYAFGKQDINLILFVFDHKKTSIAENNILQTFINF